MDELLPAVASGQDAGDVWERDLVDRVRRFARSRNWPVYLSPKWNTQAAGVMARRLEKTGVTRERITAVWNWYAANYERMPKSLPQIATVKMFDKCWGWVTDEMAKRRAPAEIPPDAKRALDRLRLEQWPDGSAVLLDGAVVQSLANLKSFLSRVRMASLPRELMGVRDRLALVVGDPVEYVVEWFAAARTRLKNRDLGWWVWTPTHPVFVGHVLEQMRKYSADDGAWRKLTAALPAQ